MKYTVNKIETDYSKWNKPEWYICTDENGIEKRFTWMDVQILKNHGNTFVNLDSVKRR